MDGSYSIGVDLGGTYLRVAAYSGGETFLDRIVLPTHLYAGRDQVVRDICKAVEALAMRKYGDRKLKGIVVGTPGPLDLPGNPMRNTNCRWDGFHLKSAITSALGRDIVLESDGNLAAFAERELGAGKRYRVDNMRILTLGTGIGNGLILNGDISEASDAIATETSRIIGDGKDSSTSEFGCLKQSSSETAVMRMARERLGGASPSSARELAMWARSGNQQARSIFDTVGQALAATLTGLISILNLPLYLLGGGVGEAWDLFSPFMFRELENRSDIYRATRPPVLEPEFLEVGKTYILKAQLGPTAGLLGACIFGLQQPICAASAEDLLIHKHI